MRAYAVVMLVCAGAAHAQFPGTDAAPPAATPATSAAAPAAAPPAPATAPPASTPANPGGGAFPGVDQLPPRADDKELATKREGLISLLRSIRKRESELEQRRNDLANPRYEGRREELEAQIKNIATDLDLLNRRFKELASGVDLEQETRTELEFDWTKEVKDLLGPAINELKRVTTRPREMDRLRREIDVLGDRLRTIERAQENLTRFVQRFPDAELAAPLAEILGEWEARHQEVSSELTYTNNRLERMRSERHSLSSTVENLVGIFFRSRGRNLILAAVSLIAFWVVFRYLQTWVERLSPFHRRGQTAAIRIFNLAYATFTGLGAMVVFLYVLYLVGDWVLLTITGLFLFGIAWASKAALPRFWEQTMLLLNLGSVREGERVVFNGLPWRVRTLSFYTHLENPELDGGDVRLPIRSVFGLTSRIFGADEPWFPTHKGEWLLVDSLPAQVIQQTPEVVVLKFLGGAERPIPAAAFMGTMPTVLSRGFRLGTVFGVDYRHQAQAIGAIPALLEGHVRAGLEEAGFGTRLKKLVVEIQQAAASSLDLLVQADFAGDAAADYSSLGRLLQRLCVEAANENGWVIPFPQLTVHRGDPREASKSGGVDVPSRLA
ncbi:MAG: hypothetical protein U0610_32015 [bacterium]